MPLRGGAAPAPAPFSRGRARPPRVSREARSRKVSRERRAAFRRAGRHDGGRQEQAAHQGRQEGRQEESVRAAAARQGRDVGRGAAGDRGWGRMVEDGSGWGWMAVDGGCCHGGPGPGPHLWRVPGWARARGWGWGWAAPRVSAGFAPPPAGRKGEGSLCRPGLIRERY